MLTALTALPDIPSRNSCHSRHSQLYHQQLQQQHHYRHHYHSNHISRNHEQRRDQHLSRMAAAAPQASATPELPNLEGIVVHRRWKILNVLGKGAFGEVHAAFDMVTKERHAIKIEPPTTKKQVLRLEIAVLKKLAAAAAKHTSSVDSDVQACPWVADFIASGKFAIETAPTADKKARERGVYSYLVMRLLGPNLSDVRRQTPSHRFPLPSTSHIAVQMLHAIETLHSIGIVHRDIKPGNFCLGPESKSSDWTQLPTAAVYMIDFGLSRRYLDSRRQVLPAREKVGFRGTSRYASLRAHEGGDLGPADDLWSLFYLIVEFVTGSLPWKGREKDRIAAIKRMHHQFDAPDRDPKIAAMPADQHITSGLPQALVTLWGYLLRLDYGVAVNYRFVEGLLRDLNSGPDGAAGGSDGERVASRTSVFTGNQAASASRTTLTGIGTAENPIASPVSRVRIELPAGSNDDDSGGVKLSNGDDEDEIMVFGKPLLRPPADMGLASSPPLPPSPPPADRPALAKGEPHTLPVLPPLPELDSHLSHLFPRPPSTPPIKYQSFRARKYRFAVAERQ
ncbi:Tau-tubulin kinase 2 [Geranomyces michiganensis]|nr:Tau-tubulin kinase 2 [Geranomyces michiganensis]